MSDKLTELAWAAGFFDGEGNVRFFRAQRAWGMRIQVSQAERTTLDRLAAAVGCGVVRGPYPNHNPAWKPKYVLTVTSVRDVREVFTQLEPYLSRPKREQFLDVFKQWEIRPLEREGYRHSVRRPGTHHIQKEIEAEGIDLPSVVGDNADMQRGAS